VEACSNRGLIQTLLDFGAEPLLATKFDSPMQYVYSMLHPCADPQEREHWQCVMQAFEDSSTHPLHQQPDVLPRDPRPPVHE